MSGMFAMWREAHARIVRIVARLSIPRAKAKRLETPRNLSPHRGTSDSHCIVTIASFTMSPNSFGGVSLSLRAAERVAGTGEADPHDYSNPREGPAIMPANTRLPRKLRSRLAELGQRLRRMHIIQGLCRLALVILSTALASVILDGLMHFPGWMRGLLLTGWVVLSALEIRRFVRGPLRQPLDAEGLASAVEQEFPRLGERLTTAVELAGSRDPANGSPELIDVVIRDAENRTRKLDLKRAAPASTTIGFAVAGFVALLAVLIPLVSVPKAGEHARRFLAPWYTPKSEASFTIKITSGDPTVGPR